MSPLERAGYLAHARTPGFCRRVERALGVVEDWLTRARRPYVAFSGGKDSSAVLHLVRSLAPDVPAVHSRADWELPETRQLLAATPGLVEIAGVNRHAEWYTAWEDSEAIPPGVVRVEVEGNSVSNSWARANGYDGAAIGLREQENNYRRVHLRSRGEVAWVESRAAWHCYPVARWATRDVWAYLLSQGVPYNRAYDRLSELGVPPDAQRVGPFANQRAMTYGQLALLKQGWPDLFEAFARAHPEARRYA